MMTMDEETTMKCETTETEQSYSNRELWQAYVKLTQERDELLLKLHTERQLKSDLENRVNVLEQSLLDALNGGNDGR
jgi:hypothetical protein